MNVAIEALYVALSYMLGAVPAVYFLAKKKGIDLKRAGSRNVGVTNLFDQTGPIVGVVGAIFDFTKGLLPPLLASGLGLGTSTTALAGIAAVIGQMWPAFLQFQGGRGNLTACAALAVIAPRALVIALVPILLGATLGLIQRRMGWGRPDIWGGALGVFAGTLVAAGAAWVLPYPLLVRWSVTGLALLLLTRRVTAELPLDLKASGRERWAIHCTRLLLDRARP